MAYDELSQVMESYTIDQRIISNIFDRISEEFEGAYLLDLDEGQHKQSHTAAFSVPLQCLFSASSVPFP